MRKKTGDMIRMMAFEGKSIRQIAEKTDLNHEEIEDYLIAQGIRPTYTVSQGKQENKGCEKVMNDQRILGKPIRTYGGKAAGKTPLTDEQKAEIRHKLECGVSVAKIAADYDCDKSWVYRMRRQMLSAPGKTEEPANISVESEAVHEAEVSEPKAPLLGDPMTMLSVLDSLMHEMFGGKCQIFNANASKSFANIKFEQDGEKFMLALAKENWTHKEDELLEAMYKSGKSASEIAETLGRSTSAVYQRKQTLTERRYINEVTCGNNDPARGSRYGCDVGGSEN